MNRFGSFVRRNNLTIGFTILFMTLGVVLLLQASATSKLQQQQIATQQQNKDTHQLLVQIKSVADKLDHNSAQRTDQINQLNKHLDCIVAFFTDGNRSQKAIADIDTCTLKNTATGQTSSPLAPTGVLTPSSSTSSGAPTQQTTTGSVTNPTTTSSPPPSGGSSQPGFLERNVISPIKDLLNGL